MNLFTRRRNEQLSHNPKEEENYSSPIMETACTCCSQLLEQAYRSESSLALRSGKASVLELHDWGRWELHQECSRPDVARCNHAKRHLSHSTYVAGTLCKIPPPLILSCPAAADDARANKAD